MTSWTSFVWKAWQSKVELVVPRCTEFNNLDVGCAKQLKLTVTRVPAYSAHAVAEHAIALLLTLNRKIHRAFNCVRELDFSLNGLVGFDLYGKSEAIIGAGKIDCVTAQILGGFGMRVRAYDPFHLSQCTYYFAPSIPDR